MKFEPTGGNVVLKGLDPDEMTTGGVIMPDIDDDSCQKGEVVAVGNGKKLDNGSTQPMDVKTGDKVLFGKYSGSEVKVGDETLLMMREEDIIGIIG